MTSDWQDMGFVKRDGGEESVESVLQDQAEAAHCVSSHTRSGLELQYGRFGSEHVYVASARQGRKLVFDHPASIFVVESVMRQEAR